MRTSLLHLVRSAMLAAALVLCGGHWVAMQSVAWTTMIVGFAQEEGLAVGLQKTFDGQHPCDICKTVSQGVSEENEQSASGTVVKLDLPWLALQAGPQVYPPAEYVLLGSSRECPEQRLTQPVTPPPRRA